MNDKKPPQGFNWSLGPSSSEEPAERKPDGQTPLYPQAPPPQQPPLAQAPPPAQVPPVAQTPPQAPPPGWPPNAVSAPAPAPAWPNTTVPPPAWPAADVPTERMSIADVPIEELPTQAMTFEPTTAMSFDPALAGPTELLGAVPVGIPEPAGEHAPQSGSAIDALFGSSQFKEYESGAFPSEGISALASTRPRVEREPMGRVQRTLLWVAGGLAAALALLMLFIVGTKIGPILPEAAPEAAQTAPATVAVTAALLPVGPVSPGEYSWDELLGSECIDPYGTAWDETYTVVDCTVPHAAQLVHHGIFSDEAYAIYPGADQLQARINLLCTNSIDYAVASQFADIQVAASYPATESDWKNGNRDYYCFVTRSTGEPFTVSVANPPVASEELVATIASNDP